MELSRTDSELGYSRSRSIESLEATDIDGDGDLDLLTSESTNTYRPGSTDEARTDTIRWYENTDGRGTFGRGQSIASRSIELQNVGGDVLIATDVADIDGNGQFDLVTLQSYVGTVLVWRSQFQDVRIQDLEVDPSIRFGRWSWANAVHATDIDGDGDLDLAMAMQSEMEPNNFLAWADNVDGNGTFKWAGLISNTGPTTIDSADLDGDGDMDLVAEDKWYENTDGKGAFVEHLDVGGTGPLVDLDQDGQMDIVTYDRQFVWLKNGDGATFTRNLISAEDLLASDTGDIDGDGDIDVVAVGPAGVYWFEQKVIVDNLGDVNGDGVSDVKDIDHLCASLAMQNAGHDLNSDGRINQGDVDFLVEDAFGTRKGDANLDFIFNSEDLLQVFARGFYDRPTGERPGWGDGDWNCDGRFDSADLVAAMITGDFVEIA
jgi:hypothetical protein